ncbi:hypothetical protein D3C84_454210 [compost metagenome]
MPAPCRFTVVIDVIAEHRHVEINLGLALIQTWKRRLQRFIEYSIEQGREGWQRCQFVEHGLMVQLLIIGDALAQVVEHVTLNDFIGHADIVAGGEIFTRSQRHQRQQVVVLAGIFQGLAELLGQRRTTVELLNAAIGGVDNDPGGFRGGAQHETAGQGDRRLISRRQQDFFGNHWWLLLAA